jgi:hypothetical protein
MQARWASEKKEQAEYSTYIKTSAYSTANLTGCKQGKQEMQAGGSGQA